MPRSSPCLPGLLSGTRRGQLGACLLGEQSPALRLPGCSLLARVVHTNVKDANLFPSPWPPHMGSACCTHSSLSLPLSARSFRWANIRLGSYLAHCSYPANRQNKILRFQQPGKSGQALVLDGFSPRKDSFHRFIIS